MLLEAVWPGDGTKHNSFLWKAITAQNLYHKGIVMETEDFVLTYFLKVDTPSVAVISLPYILSPAKSYR